MILGRIVGAFGIRGELKVTSWTRPAAGILDYAEWWLGEGDAAQPCRHSGGRVRGQGQVVVRLDGVEGRDAAEAMVGRDISVVESALPALQDGEYYWRDLIGLKVVNRDGDLFGTVAEIVETGANDVIVVNGDEELLIPWVDDVLLEVDLGAGVLQVDWQRDFNA
ncbi:ribosome maturation factor RimM [Gammaproteobacteria bacterium]|nr:ribosome maturation factor RimM [Gammaproteobacteria bacterium]